MRKVTMFMLRSCPYCMRAMQRVDKVFATHPEYRKVPFEMVDERQQPEIACCHDYYFVPTFYIDEKKVYEENVLQCDIEKIFRDAYQD
jgi:thioredoxin 1